MTEQHQPHFFARAKAAENRGVGPIVSTTLTTPSHNHTDSQGDGDEEDRGRPVNIEKQDDRQDWQSLDLSGQGLRAISLTLFARYDFVEELYLCSNNLTYLPPAIGQLRKLRHLDLSNNHITDLPPELGMCTPLRKLLVFNNQIRELPFELGALHFLELLGVQGNPLNSEMKQMLLEDDTKGLIGYLKEHAPGKIVLASLRNYCFDAFSISPTNIDRSTPTPRASCCRSTSGRRFVQCRASPSHVVEYAMR